MKRNGKQSFFTQVLGERNARRHHSLLAKRDLNPVEIATLVHYRILAEKHLETNYDGPCQFEEQEVYTLKDGASRGFISNILANRIDTYRNRVDSLLGYKIEVPGKPPERDPGEAVAVLQTAAMAA